MTTPAPSPLLTEPVPRLVRAMAIPASIGYLFNTLYNVVDTWFAGRISTDALAALGLSFPVFFAIIAVASGLATGISSVLANHLGAGRHQEALGIAAQAVTFTLAASAVLTAAGLALAPDLFRILGATGEPARLAVQYMAILFAGAVGFNLAHALNACLVARGDTHTYRNVLMLGVALNAALNPWFIHGGAGLPAMGFSGIAVSTVLIQFISAAVLYRAARRRGALPPPAIRTFRLQRTVAAELLRQSGPAMLNMMTIGLGILVITWFVNEHGRGAVAAYGIATRIEQIILLPAIGLNLAVLAVAGQNNGAGRADRVRETVRVALRFGLLALAPGFLLLFVWPGAAMAVFTDDAEVVRIGAGYLRIAAFLIYAYVILFTLTAALQAVKQPMYALWIGLYRQLLAPVAIMYALTRHTGLGIDAVWLSVAFTTWSAALFTAWYTQRTLPRG